ncbi:expressed protein [Dictyostelium purpureum]|uniref:Expressed protein n=1 Tax=Dictyostelium purpureum TaxID=5786 RepID=F1A604_DICPU|nr:uncharacterized protein DICPUDRAFT_93337 [Dictyostelium purpureum]EGC28375.1 expressed protein [Dictyostelium purpureum]|eukprot:XP_003295098.1 expressed protein [Dictyostelium purpureum]
MNIIDSFNNLHLNDNKPTQQPTFNNQTQTQNKSVTGYYNYNNVQERPIIIISLIEQ